MPVAPQGGTDVGEGMSKLSASSHNWSCEAHCAASRRCSAFVPNRRSSMQRLYSRLAKSAFPKRSKLSSVRHPATSRSARKIALGRRRSRRDSSTADISTCIGPKCRASRVNSCCNGSATETLKQIASFNEWHSVNQSQVQPQPPPPPPHGNTSAQRQRHRARPLKNFELQVRITTENDY